MSETVSADSITSLYSIILRSMYAAAAAAAAAGLQVVAAPQRSSRTE